MSKVWSDERKFQIWLEIEVLACEAMAELDQIPKNDAEQIRKRARFSIPEILEIEKRTNHDVIAFLENVAGSVGPAARWIHQGLTSSDILDTTLAVIASGIDRWATEFRQLQRTEVVEVEEFFGEGQKGSSAMPHKRNPITGERLSGLARVVRGNAVVALENVALWHERDISHSSAERIILPDSCILLDYMLTKLRDVVERLQVYPERMQQNLALTKGLYFSQSILLALTSAGAERKAAYEAVQRAAMKTWKGGGTFAENAKCEPEIVARFSASEIDRLCSLDIHFKHIDATFKALGLQ